jgi:hypothetical protein
MTVSSTKGIVAKHVKDLVFENVTVTPSQGPVFALAHAENVTIRGAKAPPGAETFLALDGANSRAVRIESSDLSGAAKPLALATDVKPGTVSVH